MHNAPTRPLEDGDITHMSDDVFERGMAVRKAVLGDEHVARAQANTTALDADFQRFITEVAWGRVWARPGLDHHTRHLITLAAAPRPARGVGDARCHVPPA
jgi:hypothetical protein